MCHVKRNGMKFVTSFSILLLTHPKVCASAFEQEEYEEPINTRTHVLRTLAKVGKVRSAFFFVSFIIMLPFHFPHFLLRFYISGIQNRGKGGWRTNTERDGSERESEPVNPRGVRAQQEMFFPFYSFGKERMFPLKVPGSYTSGTHLLHFHSLLISQLPSFLLLLQLPSPSPCNLQSMKKSMERLPLPLQRSMLENRELVVEARFCKHTASFTLCVSGTRESQSRDPKRKGMTGFWVTWRAVQVDKTQREYEMGIERHGGGMELASVGEAAAAVVAEESDQTDQIWAKEEKGWLPFVLTQSNLSLYFSPLILYFSPLFVSNWVTHGFPLFHSLPNLITTAQISD